MKQFDQLDERSRDRVARANREWTRVRSLMQHRRLLGEGDTWHGVAWTNDASNQTVLYSFTPFEFSVQGTPVAEKLTTGERSSVSQQVTTKAWHTYVIREWTSQ